jgi:ribonuclease P protein component
MVVAPSAAPLNKLTLKRQFGLVLAHPPVAHSRHFAVHVLATQKPDFSPAHGVWAGVVLPKRWAKRAVTRNALRRQIYAIATDVLGQQADNWTEQGVAVVVRLRRAFDSQQFVSAWSESLRQAVRAELLPLTRRVLSAGVR